MLSEARRHAVLAAILGLVFAGFGGCDGDPEKPQGDLSYLPHDDGFTWDYDLSRDSRPSGTARVVMHNPGEGSLKRIAFTSQIASGELLADIQPQVIRIREVTLFGRTLAFDSPLTLLELPFELGDEFHSSTAFTLALVPAQIHLATHVAAFNPVSAGGTAYNNAFRLETEAAFGAGNVSFEIDVTIWLAEDAGVVIASFDFPQNPVFPLTGHIEAELFETTP